MAIGALEIHGPRVSDAERVLTPDALAFVEKLHREFGPRRDELLARAPGDLPDGAQA
ncbi:MAG: hypothetical protein AAB284_00395, partial [Chloroflexota bacterium]